MTYHCYTDYTPKDPDTLRRMALAQATWPRQGWVEVPVKDSDLPRLWREKDRAWPFIKDIFDYACRGRNPRDIIVYTNSDIHCRSDCCQQVEKAMEQTEALYGYRRDFARIDIRVPDSRYELGSGYCGSDIYAMRCEWWEKYRGSMGDMVAGGEAWDPMMRLLIDRTNQGKQTCLRNLICHERHGGPTHWENPKNRYTWAMQKHCLRTAYAWFKARGINPAVHGIRKV